MTLDELEAQAKRAQADGQRMPLTVPSPWRNRPRGFPRGELLCEHNRGQCVRRFDPAAILAWVQHARALQAGSAE